jgi:nucleoid-associated protein YgaU
MHSTITQINPIDFTYGQLHTQDVSDPALWLAGTVAFVFLIAAAAPSVPSVLGAARSVPVPVTGVRVLVVVIALLSVGRARPGSAEVPPPMVRLADRAPASPPSVPESVADTYVVRPGDSLWRIARRHLEAEVGTSPSSADVNRFWRRIYDHNRDVIGADPDLILPGQQFEIPRR